MARQEKKARRPFADTEIESDLKAYCVKCRKKGCPMEEQTLVATYMPKSNKWRPRVTGVHKKCGTTLTVFVNKDFVDEVVNA